jgi:hypothetical protein
MKPHADIQENIEPQETQRTKFKLRRAPLVGAPWSDLLNQYRTEFDDRVLVCEPNNCDPEYQLRCFGGISIDVCRFSSRCEPDITQFGWYTGIVETRGYCPDIVHCYLDEATAEWVDYTAPAEIITRAAYVCHRIVSRGFRVKVIIDQAYFEDADLAKRVTGAWMDQMCERKSELMQEP